MSCRTGLEAPEARGAGAEPQTGLCSLQQAPTKLETEALQPGHLLKGPFLFLQDQTPWRLSFWTLEPDWQVLCSSAV